MGAKVGKKDRQRTPSKESANNDVAEAPAVLPSTELLLTVNWHITLWCNLACRYCFQQNSDRLAPQGPRLAVTVAEAFRILDALWNAGCRKITFAGGEPTLVPDLPALIRHAWALGMNVMIVTNGTGVTDEFLNEVRGCLTAVKLSIDSPLEKTLIALRRSRGDYLRRVREVAMRCHTRGIPVMMNTVVTSLNCDEDLHGIIAEIRPVRWKVFQSLWIDGQNKEEEANLAATSEQFRAFLRRHHDVSTLVPEDNAAMTDSYVMIDPWGRFFQNSGGRYRHSGEILKVGIEEALAECGGWNRERFLLRGGNYGLSSQPTRPPLPPRVGRTAKGPEPRSTEPDGWRIRVDPRAEVGALFNLKGRILDWFRNNPEGDPTGVRVRVDRAEGAVYLEATGRTHVTGRIAQSAFQYAKSKATKSQRFVAGSSLERVGR